jgi:response regulator RpfG family c-di-GMP phosphodiesterase
MSSHSENQPSQGKPTPAVQLEAIFRAIPDTLICLDSEGSLVSIKAGNGTIPFIGGEDLAGRQLQSLFPAPVGRRVQAAFLEARNSGNVISLDFQLKVSDGQRCYEAHLVPSPGSQVIAFLRDVTDRVKNEEQIHQHLQRLSALHTIDAAITSSFDLKVILSVILRQVTVQLGVDAADILLLNQLTHMLEYIAGTGFQPSSLPQPAVMVGQGFAGAAALQRRTVSIPVLDDPQTIQQFSPGVVREKFASYYAVPLIAKGQVKGVLEVYNRSVLKPTDDWFEFLATLAGQTALAIDSATLFQELQTSNLELSAAVDASIEGWSRALEASGRENAEHSQRVVEMTLQLAQALHVDERDLNDIRQGVLMHDVGMLAIPEKILFKPGPLDDREWELVRRHPQLACEFLARIKPQSFSMDIPRSHHERWDGSGYPEGLAGRQIPFVARIFAVVDVYDALITPRPYRPAWKRKAALEYLGQESDRLFDPAVVETFLQAKWVED